MMKNEEDKDLDKSILIFDSLISLLINKLQEVFSSLW